MASSLNFEAGFYKIAAFATGKNLTDEQWDLFNLEAFTCPTAIETAHRVAHGVPTYRYRYFGEWSNLALFPGNGAYHGSDLEMVFGTAEDVSLQPNTGLEDATSLYMMRAFALFAKDPVHNLRSSVGC
jgi:carboxylesterase type B